MWLKSPMQTDRRGVSLATAIVIAAFGYQAAHAATLKEYPAGYVVPYEFTDLAANEKSWSLKEWRLMPPEEFDHPPDKPFKVIQLGPNDPPIWAWCKWPNQNVAGCTNPRDRVIIIADPDFLTWRNTTVNIILRHEIGHLNGWPPDHPGAR